MHKSAAPRHLATCCAVLPWMLVVALSAWCYFNLESKKCKTVVPLPAYVPSSESIVLPVVATVASGNTDHRSSLADTRKAVPLVRLREDIASTILESEGLKVGAELGVKFGMFAKHNLNRWPSCVKYVLVDLWAPQEHYKDLANKDKQTQEKTYQHALALVAPFKNKVEVCRNYTTACAALYDDETFDFVYVDARHDYKGVLADLEAWWPKVRAGGIFAGHDYMSAHEVKGQDWSLSMDGTRNFGAVKGAVDEFFMSGNASTNLHYRQVSITYREKAYNSWLVRK